MDGSEVRTERRYTDFAALHDELYVAQAMPAAFPVAPGPQSLQWLRILLGVRQPLLLLLSGEGLRSHLLMVGLHVMHQHHVLVVPHPEAGKLQALPSALVVVTSNSLIATKMSTRHFFILRSFLHLSCCAR